MQSSLKKLLLRHRSLLAQQNPTKAMTILVPRSATAVELTTATLHGGLQKNNNYKAATTTIYKNNADLILPISIDASSSSVHDQVLRVACLLCPFLLHNNNSDTLQATRLSGGLSNELYIVESTINSKKKTQVLVRIHPTIGNDSALLDRSAETKLAAWLAQHANAPTVYGRFTNGRVEEFYSNHFPLKHSCMHKYEGQMARHMADLHALDVPHSVLPSRNTTSIWERVRGWLDMIHDEDMQQTNKLRSEWAWLEEALFATSSTTCTHYEQVARDFCRQVVVCHMDAQSLNFLCDSNGNELKWIDFEYVGRNARAVDIANTFCEHANMNEVRAKYETDYPSDKHQDEFLCAYICRLQEQTSGSTTTTEPCTNTALQQIANALQSSSTNSAMLRALRETVAQYTLVSHLSWAVWSLAQRSLSSIEFDYDAYAHHRLDGYQYCKQVFWK
jgi:thiamine kinase-like enzyme